MMTLHNIDFNKISYEDGLALVKEAEVKRGMAKVAEGGGEGDGGGIVEAIKGFIKKNPEFLTRVGIGAAGGGTLGLLSSLTESPRSRRPIRRGLIGALLGATGGAAAHTGISLYDKYLEARAVENIKDWAVDAINKGHTESHVVSRAVEQAEDLGFKLDPADIRRAIPESPPPPPGITELLTQPPDPDSWMPGLDIIPPRIRLAAMGGAAGAIVGDPWARGTAVERAALTGSEKGAPFEARITPGKAGGIPDKALATSVDNIKNYVAGRSRWRTLGLPSGREWQSPVHRPQGTHGRIRSPIRAPLQQDYARAFRALGRPQSRVRGAAGGAALFTLAPELITAGRRLLGLYRQPDLDTAAIDEALKHLTKPK